MITAKTIFFQALAIGDAKKYPFMMKNRTEEKMFYNLPVRHIMRSNHEHYLAYSHCYQHCGGCLHEQA